MDPLTLVAISFAPGIFWLWYFARRAAYRPSPRRLIATTFVLGMAAAIPAALIEAALLPDDLFGRPVSTGLVLSLFLVVGPVEEAAKFLSVRLYGYRSPYFDEPMDGLVLAAAASLGFASLENLFYVFQEGPGVILSRAPISTLAHVILGGMWGLALGLSKHSTPSGTLTVVVGLATAALLHGAFDAALVGGYTVIVAVALFAVGAVWLFSRFEWARRVSHPARPVLELYCGHCNQTQRPDARYCTNCGDRLVRGREARKMEEGA
jgi:RsiW-degrading membrane proteinase PrsW (M82 family)